MLHVVISVKARDGGTQVTILKNRTGLHIIASAYRATSISRRIVSLLEAVRAVTKIMTIIVMKNGVYEMISFIEARLAELREVRSKNHYAHGTLVRMIDKNILLNEMILAHIKGGR